MPKTWVTIASTAHAFGVYFDSIGAVSINDVLGAMADQPTQPDFRRHGEYPSEARQRWPAFAISKIEYQDFEQNGPQLLKTEPVLRPNLPLLPRKKSTFG